MFFQEFVILTPDPFIIWKTGHEFSTFLWSASSYSWVPFVYISASIITSFNLLSGPPLTYLAKSYELSTFVNLTYPIFNFYFLLKSFNVANSQATNDARTFYKALLIYHSWLLVNDFNFNEGSVASILIFKGLVLLNSLIIF